MASHAFLTLNMIRHYEGHEFRAKVSIGGSSPIRSILQAGRKSLVNDSHMAEKFRSADGS